MKRLCAVLFTFALAAGIGLAQRWVPLEAGQPEQPARFEVRSSNLSSTVVELNLSGLHVTDVQEGGRTYQQLELGIEAGGLLTGVGAPQMPVVGRLIAIPDDKNVRVEVLEREEVTLAGYRVYPAQPPLPDNQSSQPFVIDESRYGKNEFYPDAGARAGEPMIMRDFRVAQLVLQPVRFNPVTGELRVTRRLRVALRYEGYSNVNTKTRHRPHVSRAFEPLYAKYVANYDFVRPPQRAEDGSYLIIVNDAFAGAVTPFAAWKQRKGWRTKVVTTTEVGGNDTAHIYSYISNAYNNWPYPPDYVLLVGDAPEYVACNHWPGHTDASDLYYSLHEGSDILADLMIGRACVRSLSEAQTVMNKLYRFEMDPYMGNTQWFNKVCALAAYEGSPRFWSVVIRIRNYFMGRPVTQFDTLFERWGLNTATGLRDSLNLGRSWMLYRGHGDVAAWANVSGGWTNSNVHALSNGRMTPLVIGPTCLSGDFDNPSTDCHAEAWVKAGTPDTARGGCGYFGSSEVSYSGYNDSLAAGTFFTYVDSLSSTFGQCTYGGKLFLMESYPLPDQITEEEVYMFNNFGDPELNPWSMTPRQLTVQHPATVLIGSFPFPVTVTYQGSPVQNAQVCVMSAADTSVFYVGHTDGSGQVQFTLQTTLPGDTLLVTVTGRNLAPYLASVRTIAPNSAYVTYLKCFVVDSAPGGNGDGIINPGETIKLPTWVKNWGSVSAPTVVGTLRKTDPNITLLDSARSFGTIGAGDSAFTGQNGYRFTVATACTNGYALAFTLRCRDANDSVWLSNINLWVGAPVLGYSAKAVNDPPPGGNGDGKLDPGETAELLITLRNSGLGHGYNVNAKLRSGDARMQVLDSSAAYGTIPKDTTGTNTADPFRVHADDSIAREEVIPCTLLIVADGGYSRVIPFSIMVGEVRAVDPIPDGPRQPPLYWAYDDADSAYTEAPEFNWVEIRNQGTRLSLSDDQTVTISLPSGFGPFVYYGQSYTQVSICSNGWVAPGATSTTTYNNTVLPNSSMPPAMFVDWDDLYPPAGGGVWYYHDAANNRFIVEYDSVRYYSGSIYDKYEIVLYDTTQAAADGNCEFTFQYLVATGLSSATVGEQDPTRAIAIQVLFDGSYHRGASTITAGRAIKYTTDEPRTGLAEETGVAGLGRARFSVRPTMFRGRASVRFGLARAGAVHLAVYDMTGRQVRELAAQTLPAGTHAFAWDGRDDSGRRLAQGVYVVRLDAGGEKLGVKAVLLQ